MAGLYFIAGVGLPGAGKSTFLERFSAENHWFYWRGDEVRRRIFDQPQHDEHETHVLSRASKYALEAALKVGLSAVYDANIMTRASRERQAALAARYGAEFRLLWFDVPEAVALERAERREDTAHGDWKTYLGSFEPKEIIPRMMREIEWPTPDEPVIRLDGQAPYETQRAEVLRRLGL